MSKKNKVQSDSIRTDYDLKEDAVNRLANAKKGTAKKVSDKELNKYQKPILPWLPKWAKAAFIKWWFAGAICYFFLWGLGTVIQNQLDILFVLWIALGIATDLLTNNVLRFIQQEKEYEPYIMLPAKKFYTFFVNILYALPLLVGTVLVYELINNILVIMMRLPEGSVPLGVEPICFGLFYTGLDFIGLWIRNSILKIKKS